jgi:hypothetical protein
MTNLFWSHAQRLVLLIYFFVLLEEDKSTLLYVTGIEWAFHLPFLFKPNFSVFIFWSLTIIEVSLAAFQLFQSPQPYSIVSIAWFVTANVNFFREYKQEEIEYHEI